MASNLATQLAVKKIKNDIIEKSVTPIFKALKTVEDSLKKMYSAHGEWIFQDSVLMGVLNEQRGQYEKNEKKIDTIVDEEKQKAHEEIEERFARIRDTRLLKLQLVQMRQELVTLKNAAKVRNSMNHGKV